MRKLLILIGLLLASAGGVRAQSSFPPTIYQNGGTNLGPASRFNCSTGTTCTLTGGTVAITSSGGGSGTVASCGTQFAFFYALATGTTATCDPNLTDNGTDITLGLPMCLGTCPSGITSGAQAGFGATEATSTGWTPTTGLDYIRFDSTQHGPMFSFNDSAEAVLFPTGIIKGVSDAPAAAAGSDISTLVQALTGCNTASNVYTPQGNDCVAQSGGGGTGCTSGCSYVLTSGDQLIVDTAGGTGLANAEQGQYVMFYNALSRKLGNVCVNVQTLSSGGHADVSVYSISGTTGTKQWETGSFSTTSTGTQCFTPTAYSMAGGADFYISWCADNTVAKLVVLNPGSLTLVGNAVQYPAHTSGIDATDTCATGVSPATITTTNITNGSSMNVPYALISN